MFISLDTINKYREKMEIVNSYIFGSNKSKNIKKNKTQKKGIKKMNCSPYSKKKRSIKETCYTDDVLIKIRNEYNKKQPKDNRITTTDPKEIWRELNMRLMYCEKEECFLKQIEDTKIRKQLDSVLFAPDSPDEWKKNPNEWLSNYDIMNVMNQYEYTYKNFKYLGPSPIDFDARFSDGTCVTEEICNLDLGALRDKGYNKIGVTFNLDRHDQSGSHWVSLFVDLEDKFIFYFDSAGDDIPKEIDELKNRIIKQGKEISPAIKFEFYKNYRSVHQRGNTECGMYSLFFIITMLTGETEYEKNMSKQEKIKLFKKKKIPDKYVEKYRKIYFNS